MVALSIKHATGTYCCTLYQHRPNESEPNSGLWSDLFSELTLALQGQGVPPDLPMGEELSFALVHLRVWDLEGNCLIGIGSKEEVHVVLV